MNQGWITALLLAFGIAVGIVGVVAYLRLFRKERLAALAPSSANSSPSAVASAESDTNGQQTAVKNEQNSSGD